METTELLSSELLKSLLAPLLLILMGIGMGLNNFFKSTDYFKQLIYQRTFGKPLTISLLNHPLFKELQSFIEVEQHHAHFDEQHRNYIFVNYTLVFTKALHRHFIEFCELDLDQKFETMEDFESGLQALYNKTFGSCLIEVKQKFTFNEDMFFKIHTHQQESLAVFKLGIKRILDDTTFDEDRQPNKRKMWRILDSLAQSKDEYRTKTKAYFKGLNGQMASVSYNE